RLIWFRVVIKRLAATALPLRSLREPRARLATAPCTEAGQPKLATDDHERDQQARGLRGPSAGTKLAGQGSRGEDPGGLDGDSNTPNSQDRSRRLGRACRISGRRL